MEWTTRSNAYFPRILDIALLILVIILAAPANADAETCFERYEIQPKDTFAMIARTRRRQLHKRFKLFGPNGMVQKMIALNGGRVANPDVIPPGFQIALPPELSEPGKRFACPMPEPVQREVASVPPVTSDVTQAAPPAQVTANAESSRASEPSADFPRDFELTMGVAGLGDASTIKFPNGNIDVALFPTDMLGFRGTFNGFSQTYNDGVSPVYTALQGQAKGQVELRFLRYFSVGLGYRYFTFGNPYPTGVALGTNDAVGSLGFQANLSRTVMFRTTADFRYAVSMTATGDIYTFSPQFAGFNVFGELRILLSPNVYVGPYYFYDSTRLNWTQADIAATYSVAGTLDAPVYGTGLQIGFGF